MKILALQLKRIGDLVLTTPALTALKTALPEAHLTIGVDQGTASLLPALPQIDAAIVFGRGRGWTPWQQALTGRFDAVLDFTGSDRSALAARLTRAKVRTTFAWVKKKRLRQLAYTGFIDSPVRERHTADHYGDLLQALIPSALKIPESPVLSLPAGAAEPLDVGRWVLDVGCSPPSASDASPGPAAVFHPFTARPEKNWLPERWAEVLHHCLSRGVNCTLTGGDSPEEQQHHSAIIHALEERIRASSPPPPAGVLTTLAGHTDLPGLARIMSRADLVISCDTAAVHFAAAFQRPQIVLFGPTNPFHWRPRHEHAIILSAAHPDAPLTEFQPRMSGAPMEQVSTALVIRATDSLLALRRSST